MTQFIISKPNGRSKYAQSAATSMPHPIMQVSNEHQPLSKQQPLNVYCLLKGHVFSGATLIRCEFLM